MILDYIEEYGKTPFSKEPLNYLDLLAFAGLSYLDYPAHCIGKTLHQALKEAHSPIVPGEDETPMVAMQNDEDAKLAVLVGGAPRYRHVHLSAFESIYHEKLQQFAAMALSLGDLSIVVFRGTDETITGWEEALKLSLEEPVGAQVDAVHFLEERMKESTGPIVVCGHSKGGNLAEFSAAVCAGESEELAARIAEVVSFDGPGLSPELRKTLGYSRIAGRIRTFIPRSSIVGTIYEHPDGAVTFIDSNKRFLEQHFIYNWKTDGTRLVPRRQSIAGHAGSFALGSLIKGMNDDQKKGLFKAIFALPRAIGRKKL